MERDELLEKCGKCKSHKPTDLFDLCTREESQYNVAGVVDFHTIGHMRRNECGKEPRLWRPVL